MPSWASHSIILKELGNGVPLRDIVLHAPIISKVGLAICSVGLRRKFLKNRSWLHLMSQEIINHNRLIYKRVDLFATCVTGLINTSC